MRERAGLCAQQAVAAAEAGSLAARIGARLS